jgi:hypothetical protein
MLRGIDIGVHLCVRNLSYGAPEWKKALARTIEGEFLTSQGADITHLSRISAANVLSLILDKSCSQSGYDTSPHIPHYLLPSQPCVTQHITQYHGAGSESSEDDCRGHPR